MGGKDGHAGVIHIFSRFAGHTHPTCGQKGVSLRPLVHRGPVSPPNALEKKAKKSVCVLGKVCGHLASVIRLSLGR